MVSAAVMSLLWITVIWRAPAARRTPIKKSLWLALTGLAIALTVELPWSITIIDRATGVTDLATLIKHVVGVGACAAVLDWVIALTEPQRIHWHLRHRHSIAAAAATALAVLFFLAPRTESTYYFASTDGNNIAIAYLLVFESYLGFAMALAAQMFWTGARRARTGFLRLGLWLLTAGTLLGTLYAIVRVTMLLIWLAGGSMPDGNQAAAHASDALQALAIGLILLGISIPTAEVAWRTWSHLRDLLTLRPLWQELSRALPTVVLGVAPSLRDDVTATRHLGIRRLRRVIEIRDAVLLLRQHITESDWQRIHELLRDARLHGTDLDAAAQAAWLGVALRSHARGEQPAHNLTALPAHGAREIEGEVRWLRAVAKARRSPLVQAIERQVDQARTTHGEPA
ncbi:MAG TPA: MAB_1171c family putative transporter [Actinocrinis sp.]|nr:MAB_1171c family putative transporter [Actinocrinis sp.]